VGKIGEDILSVVILFHSLEKVETILRPEARARIFWPKKPLDGWGGGREGNGEEEGATAECGKGGVHTALCAPSER